MFPYCNCNPVNFQDFNGQSKKHLDVYFMGGRRTDYPTNSDLCLVSSNGVYVSANIGVFTITATAALAVDMKGNMQLHGGMGFDVTTAGSFSGSLGIINNWCVAPDISSLLGDGYSIGESLTAVLPESSILLSNGNNLFHTGDGYWGISHSSGIAGKLNADISLTELLGFELHGGYAYGVPLSPPINVFEIIDSFASTMDWG